MNAIVKLNRKPAYLLTSLAALDAFALEAQAVVDIRVRIGKSVDQEPHTLEQADRQIAALLDLEPCEQTINEVTRRLVDGLQPAATEQTRQEIALLVGAFPSGNVPDPAVYSPMMLREVIAIRPSVLALAAACNKLRRTCRWQPPIADVLQAIREEEALWQYRLRCVSEVSHEQTPEGEAAAKAALEAGLFYIVPGEDGLVYAVPRLFWPDPFYDELYPGEGFHVSYGIAVGRHMIWAPGDIDSRQTRSDETREAIRRFRAARAH